MGDIAVNTDYVEKNYPNIKATIDIYNGLMGLVGIKNLVTNTGFKNLYTNLPQKVKQAYQENKSIKPLIAAEYLKWNIAFKSLKNTTAAEEQLLTKQQKIWKAFGVVENTLDDFEEIKDLVKLASKLKANTRFVDELSKLEKYNNVDDFLVQFEKLHKASPSNSVKSLDKVIEDFYFLINNHLDDLTAGGKTQFKAFMSELTQTSDKFKAGATTLEVVKNPASYIPSKFSLQKLELEDLISYADDAGDFRFDIKWKALNESGKEVSIFVDTKNYSQAGNMFKDLRQFKAYLGSIDNFDQMYYIQQGGRGVNQQQIINRLQSVIKGDVDGVYKSNESLWRNIKIGDNYPIINKTTFEQFVQSNIFNEYI